MIVEFFVPGTARTAGSKTVSILWQCQNCKKRTKKAPETPRCLECNRVSLACTFCGSGNITPTPIYRPAGKYTKPWMDTVKTVAMGEYLGEIQTGPIGMIVMFQMKRPKGHCGTGRNVGIIKERYLDAQPTGRPDLIKCVRAIEDALKGIVWADDSQVVWSLPNKRYADKTGAYIQIMTADEFEEKLRCGIILEDLK